MTSNFGDFTVVDNFAAAIFATSIICSTPKYVVHSSFLVASLQSPLIKTPLSRVKHLSRSMSNASGTGDSSPKIPKLSPKVFKREKIEFDIAPKAEEVTPRRLTRQAAHDSARKSQSTPQNTASSTTDPDVEKQPEVIPNKRRDTRRRKHSENSNCASVIKTECVNDGGESFSTGVVSRRADPPPPLLIPSIISNQASGHSSVASSGDSGQQNGRENIVESVLAWKLLPDYEAIKIPPYPSLVYGAHHLLRLFGECTAGFTHVSLIITYYPLFSRIVHLIFT